MIDREYESIIKFYLKKLLPLYLVSVLWCFIYGIGSTDLMTNLVSSLKIGVTAKHLWYLPILLQLYAMIPFLSYMRILSDRDLLLFLVACICLSWLGIFKIMPIVSGNMVSYVLIYVTYGYLCYNRKIYKRLPWLFWLILLVGFGFLFVWTDWNPAYRSVFSNTGIDIWWYYSPFLMLTGLAFYALLLNVRESGKIFTVISKCAFGMYTMHLALVNIIFEHIEFVSVSVLRTVILFCLVFVCSLTISFIVGKIPFIRKVIWQ